ncbi:hypothetical protein NMD86_07575 [Edwardsiella tarda]
MVAGGRRIECWPDQWMYRQQEMAGARRVANPADIGCGHPVGRGESLQGVTLLRGTASRRRAHLRDGCDLG